MSDKNNISPEESNEELFKNTAFTFSLEGMSRDLETYIQKKITFNNRNFKHVSDIMRSLSSCDPEVQKIYLTKRGSSLNEMLKETLNELKQVNTILDLTIEKIMDKEHFFKQELNEKNKEDVK